MRANAASRERSAVDRITSGAYTRQLEQRKGLTPFVLHDGPPYANGPVHTGHLLNKTIKDIINRTALLRGQRVVFLPGETPHRLPCGLGALAGTSSQRRRLDA